ncbi:hypothetical protein HGK34_22145, partial [Myceligenerans sp. I2]|nr:hypothetical protein [Myceligenerans indicum]
MCIRDRQPPAPPQFDEGHPSGAFGPIDSTPFEPPVIDSQWQESAPGQAAPAGQNAAYAAAPEQDPVYDWSSDPAFGTQPAFAGQPDLSPTPDFATPPDFPVPGAGAQAGYPPNAQAGYPPDTQAGYPPDTQAGYPPDTQAGYPPAPDAPPAPFPGQAPEAQIPPVPTDESIRANTPGLFDEEDDPDLEALARSFGAPTRIVWSRPRRSQHHEAILHPNGVIELADGGQYRHPDTAATAASGSYTADGWSVWRIGEQGPSLTEAFQQRFV